MVFFVLFRDTVSPSAFGEGTLRCDGFSSLVIESICYKGVCYRTDILDMFCHRPVCWWYPDGPDFIFSIGRIKSFIFVISWCVV